MWVRSLGWEDPLEEGTATYSSFLAWRIPWTEVPGGLWCTGSQRIRHNWSDLACRYTWGNTVVFQYSRNLAVSLKLPSSTGVRALVPTEESKGIRNQDRALIDSAIWNTGKVKETEWSPLSINKKWVNGMTLGGPLQGPVPFHLEIFKPLTLPTTFWLSFISLLST